MPEAFPIASFDVLLISLRKGTLLKVLRFTVQILKENDQSS